MENGTDIVCTITQGLETHGTGTVSATLQSQENRDLGRK
jgi:hypothetical protein